MRPSYRPTYLKDEAGYVKREKHLLMKIYTHVGMLGYAGMNGKVMAKATAPPISDEAVNVPLPRARRLSSNRRPLLPSSSSMMEKARARRPAPTRQ